MQWPPLLFTKLHSPNHLSAKVYGLLHIGEQGWHSNESACLPPLWPQVQFLDLTSHVGWVTCWFSTLLRGFLRVRRFCLPHKKTNFQLPNWSGKSGQVEKSHCVQCPLLNPIIVIINIIIIIIIIFSISTIIISIIVTINIIIIFNIITIIISIIVIINIIIIIILVLLLSL